MLLKSLHLEPSFGILVTRHNLQEERDLYHVVQLRGQLLTLLLGFLYSIVILNTRITFDLSLKIKIEWTIAEIPHRPRQASQGSLTPPSPPTPAPSAENPEPD